MKRQVRQGVFETNSSSTHTISIVENHTVILTDEEYKKYENGEIILTERGEIIFAEDIKNKSTDKWNNCEKGEWPKKYFKNLKEYIKQEIKNEDVKQDSINDFHIFHNKREINGEYIHAISITSGESMEVLND